MSVLSLVKVPPGKPREFFLCLLSSPQPLPPQHSSSKEAVAYTFPNVSVTMLHAHGGKPRPCLLRDNGVHCGVGCPCLTEPLNLGLRTRGLSACKSRKARSDKEWPMAVEGGR